VITHIYLVVNLLSEPNIGLFSDIYAFIVM